MIGLGSFGTNIAVSLAKKGNEVAVLDSDVAKVYSMEGKVAQAIAGDATKSDVLSGMSVEDADAVVVSLGPTVEPSIMVVYHLKHLRVRNIVAKALSEDHATLLQMVGAHKIVYPEKDEALRLSNILSSVNILDYIPISKEYTLAETTCPAKFQSKTLKELDLRNKYGVLVIGIRENTKTGKFEIPNPDTKLTGNQTLYIIGKTQDVNKFAELSV